MPKEQWNLNGNYTPWYVGWWSNSCDIRASDILKHYYDTPFFLPKGSHVRSQEWFFIGTPGFGASFHQDKWHNPMWQAQVQHIILSTLTLFTARGVGHQHPCHILMDIDKRQCDHKLIFPSLISRYVAKRNGY